ncbi:uncharacterized protein IL334_005820 [Kwoniella shivajii]|uniref:Uncharacterized protein n=1 Tax=Kwoniella shivajii TaxID=564305 RepID=A0ABZ1D6A0_9TREE|nr:hypothetical protein IL334_005820 [Kwoniella shivajii]
MESHIAERSAQVDESCPDQRMKLRVLTTTASTKDSSAIYSIHSDGSHSFNDGSIFYREGDTAIWYLKPKPKSTDNPEPVSGYRDITTINPSEADWARGVACTESQSITPAPAGYTLDVWMEDNPSLMDQKASDNEELKTQPESGAKGTSSILPSWLFSPKSKAADQTGSSMSRVPTRTLH